MIEDLCVSATNMYITDSINTLFMVVLSSIVMQFEVTRIRITVLKAVNSALKMYVVFIRLLIKDDELRVYQRHNTSIKRFKVPIAIGKKPYCFACSLA